MRAIRYDRYGGPDVLHVVDVNEPSAPGEHELLIRVRAAEATKADCELRSFRFSVLWFWLPLRLVIGVWRPRRQILGSYFAGEVAAVGEAVDGFAVGDRVFGSTGLHLGAYGQWVCLPASLPIAHMPASMSFADAAALPLGGLNALHFLRLAGIEPGQAVLINGAGGSIGAHAVQIAKAMGAEVTAIDAAHKRAFVESMGADRFIDYRSEDFTGLGPRFDVVFDMVAGSRYRDCIGVLAPNGIYLSGNPRLATMVRSILTTRMTDKTARVRFAREDAAGLNALARMADRGAIRSIVERVLPMEQAPLAHRLVESEARRGAIVIDLWADAGVRDSAA